jgi:hypothetical protein
MGLTSAASLAAGHEAPHHAAATDESDVGDRSFELLVVSDVRIWGASHRDV